MNVSIKNREDAAAVLLDMIRPLKTKYSQGYAWLRLGNTGAQYETKITWMEAYARVLWGLGPLWAGKNENLSSDLAAECEEWLIICRTGLINGTNPEHPEYWGDLADYDQRMVEMASLAVTISLSPDKFWEELNKEQKQNLYSWLNQINGKKLYSNNWRFFRILVNMTFRLLNLPWSQSDLNDDFQLIESCYTGDGWYYDGNPGQIDYYIPFAIHFYSLVYAGLMKEKEPETALRLIERGKQFSKDFLYWFAADGNEVPFGRSLTYRFAHSAFFSAMAFADAEGPGYGIMKHLMFKNLENWLRRPVFDNAGVLSIGYGYPNLFMSEQYNASGSPYWALKTFLMLALSDHHPFWCAEEEIPVYEKQKLLKHPHMLIIHEEGNHVMAYAAGQHSLSEHGACREKYEKFVYSNQFGFSVSRGNSLEEGAFDSTLAVSEADGNFYRMRCGVDCYEVTEKDIYLKYQIIPGVVVESTIVPYGPWHVRIHKITTEKAIDIADGGFALGIERGYWNLSEESEGSYKEEWIEQTENSLSARFPWGTSCVMSLTGGKCTLIHAFPDTNLLNGHTVIPTVIKRLEPGTHTEITCVLGAVAGDIEAYLKNPPEIF